MTLSDKVQEFLTLADGDAHRALVMAVKCLALTGLTVSAGYVRRSPYVEVAPAEERGEVLDV